MKDITESTVRVSVLRHPFKTEREEHIVERSTAQKILENLGVSGPVLLLDTDRKIKVEDTPESDHLIVRCLPEGTLQEGGAASVIVGALMVIAGTAVAFIPGAGLMPGLALIGSGVGLISSGTMMLNADVQAKATAAAAAREQQISPSIRGSKNRSRTGAQVPVLLGKHLIVPDNAAVPRTSISSDAQYFHQLFCAGYDDIVIDTSTIKIGSTPITDYSDVLYDVQKGETGGNTYYTDRYVENRIGTKITVSDGAITRRTATNCRTIQVVINFSGGLVEVDGEGTETNATVEYKIEYQPVGAGSWTTLFDSSKTAASLTPKRYVHDVTLDNLLPSDSEYVANREYDVRVTRVTADTDDTSISDEFYWETLQSLTGTFDDVGGVDTRAVPSATNQELTMFGIQIKATEQLSGILDEVNFVGQLWTNNYSGSGSGAAQWTTVEATRNPASMFLYVLQNPAINKHPVDDADIDWASLETWWSFCDTKGFECNALVTGDITIEKLLSYITLSGRASWIMLDGKYTIIVDDTRSTVVQHFTPRNSWGFQGSKAFADRPVNLKMQFIDADSGYVQVERIVNYDESSGTVGYDSELSGLTQEVQMFGVTDPEHAAKLGAYQLACIYLRPEIFTFNVDIEYLISTRGDRVRLNHDVPLLGLASGRISEVTESGGNTLGFVSDESIQFEYGTTYAVVIRKNDGTAVTKEVTNPATPGNPVFSTTMTFASAISGISVLNVEDLFAFGESGSETRDLLITEVQPGPNADMATIVCVDYVPDIYTADSGSIPTYDAGISKYNLSLEEISEIPDPTAALQSVRRTTVITDGSHPTFSEVLDGFDEVDGSTTPLTPTGLTVLGNRDRMYVEWDPQTTANGYATTLTNLMHWEVQVSDTGVGDGYALGTDGTDWKTGASGGYTIVQTPWFQHLNIPNDGTPPAETGRTLYYRVRTRTTASDVCTWSAYVDGTTTPLLSYNETIPPENGAITGLSSDIYGHVTVTFIVGDDTHSGLYSASEYSGLRGHRIYRRLNAGGTEIQRVGDVNDAAQTTFVDETPVVGTAYDYGIAAYDNNGNECAIDWYGTPETPTYGLNATLAAPSGDIYGHVSLSFTPVSDTESRRSGHNLLRRIKSGSTDPILVGFVDEGQTSFVDETASLGVEYEYGVQSVEKDGTLSTVSWNTSNPVTPIYGLNGTVAAPVCDIYGHVTITVTPASDTESRRGGHRIWRRIDITEADVQIVGILDDGQLTFVDETPLVGTDYEYGVQVFEKDGTESTIAWQSTEVTITYGLTATLAAPSGDTYGHVSLSFTPVSDIESRRAGHNIYRRVKSGSADPVVVATLDEGETAFVDETAVIGTEYEYGVQAFEIDGTTSTISWNTSDPVTPAYTLNGSITNLSGSSTAQVTVTLSLASDPESRRSGHHIWRRENGTGNDLKIVGSTEASETSLLDETSLDDITYDYGIQVFEDDGTVSSISWYGTPITPQWTEVPDTPASIEATAYPRLVALSWEGVGGPAGPYTYTVEFSADGSFSSPSTLVSSEDRLTYTHSIAADIEYTTVSSYRYRVKAIDTYGNESGWQTLGSSPTRDASYGVWAPIQVPAAAIKATGVNRTIGVLVQRQGYSTAATTDDLIEADGIRVRISIDDSNWFEPNFDAGTAKGTDADRWKVDPGDGYADIKTYGMQFFNMPLTNETDDTVAVTSETYYLQFAYLRKDGTVGSWSSSVSVVLEPTGARDVVQNAIKAKNLDPNALASVQTNLECWVPMDDLSNPVDVSGNGRTVTAQYVGSADEVAGVSGNAVDLDGVNDSLYITDWSYPAAWTDPWTVSVWIYTPTGATWGNGYIGSIVTRGTYVGAHGLVRSATTDKVEAFIREDSGTRFARSDTLSRDTWHHIVATWDGSSTLELWVDGVLEATQDSISAIGTPDAENWSIGDAKGFAGSSGNHMEGRVDEVRIYSAVLSEAQIKFLYMIPSGDYGVQIEGIRIKDGTITADKMLVTELSAITANIGTITDGALESDSTYNFWDLDTGEFRVGNSTVYLWFDPSGGGTLSFVGAAMEVDSSSVTIDGTLDVTGATTLSSTLDVTGLASLNGGLSITDAASGYEYITITDTTGSSYIRMYNPPGFDAALWFTEIGGDGNLWLLGTDNSNDLFRLYAYQAQGGAGNIIEVAENSVQDALVISSASVNLAADTDTEVNAARTSLYNTAWSDNASISHYDQRAASGGYILRGLSTGTATAINAATGGDIYHKINDSTVMKMNETGLNIGSSDDPGSPLDVYGTNNAVGIQLRNTAGASVIQLWPDSDGDGYFRLLTSAGLETVRIRADSNHIFFNHGGNVGIGTSSPATNLHILNDSVTATLSSATAEVMISSASPQLFFDEADATVDNQLWDILVSGETFSMRAVNDANSSAGTWVSVSRTGTTIDSVAFPNGNVDIGGGYGSSGVTITDAGIIYADGAVVTDSYLFADTTAGSVAVRMQSPNGGTTETWEWYLNDTGDYLGLYHRAGATTGFAWYIDYADHSAWFDGSITMDGTTFTMNGGSSGCVIDLDGYQTPSYTALPGAIIQAPAARSLFIEIDGNDDNDRLAIIVDPDVSGLPDTEAFSTRNDGHSYFGEGYSSGGAEIHSDGDIYTAGSIGAGTNLPEVKIHAYDSASDAEIRITSATASIAQLSFGDTANTDIGRIRYDNSQDSMDFFTNDTEQMILDSGGNLGLGVDPGTIKMHLYNASTETMIRVETDGTNVDAGIEFYTASDAWSLYVDESDSQSLKLNSTYDYVIFDTSGQLGISGTPYHPLQVESYGGAANVVMKFGISSGYAGRIYSRGTGSSSNYRDFSIYGNDVAIYTATSNEGSSSSIALSIAHTTQKASFSADVDISGDLTVTDIGVGSIAGSTIYGVMSRAEEQAINTFRENISNFPFLIETDYTADYFQPGVAWYTADNNASKTKAAIYTKVTSSGSFLYLATSQAYATGVNRPGFYIDYDGIAYVPYSYNNTTGSSANCYLGTGGEIFRSTSSLRYKDNVVDYDFDYGQAFDAMKIREFDFVPTRKREVGFIAEEMAKVNPHFAEYDEKDRPDAINWNQLTVGLISEIKKLRKRIAVLESA